MAFGRGGDGRRRVLRLLVLDRGPAPGQFESLFDFSPQQIISFDKFWSERTGDRGKEEIPFTKGKDERGRVVYRDADGNPWQRTSASGMMTAIIVEENGEKHRFEAEMTPRGAFKVDDSRPLRYVEQDGRRRVMTDDAIGEISTTRYGVLFGNLLLNCPPGNLVSVSVAAAEISMAACARLGCGAVVGICAAGLAGGAGTRVDRLAATRRLCEAERKVCSAPQSLHVAAKHHFSICTWNNSPYSPNSGKPCIRS